MSLFQFLASDKLLKEVKNPYIEFISINYLAKLHNKDKARYSMSKLIME